MISTVCSPEDYPGQVGAITRKVLERFIVEVWRGYFERGGAIITLASNEALRDKHVQCVHFRKMEDKRLTGERYSLHFEVCTRDPIGVGKRNGQQHQARYSKAFGWRRRLLNIGLAVAHPAASLPRRQIG